MGPCLLVCCALMMASMAHGLNRLQTEKVEQASLLILSGGRLMGSGFRVDDAGHALTAAHVLDESTGVLEVEDAQGRRWRARAVALDRRHDLALLHVECPPGERFAYLELAPHSPDSGDEAWLFGAAYFRTGMLLRGNMARAIPTHEYLSTYSRYIHVVHYAAPSPPGTSGGCWLDASGRVCGVQSGFISVNGVGQGIAMSAPLEALRSLLTHKATVPAIDSGTAYEEIWSQGEGFLARFPPGIRGLAPVLPRAGGPAEKAGLVGDMIIVAIDGLPTPRRDLLLQHLYTKKRGDAVQYSIVLPDGNGTRVITLHLEESR
jgi:S1-C subfamily serine protease